MRILIFILALAPSFAFADFFIEGGYGAHTGISVPLVQTQSGVETKGDLSVKSKGAQLYKMGLTTSDPGAVYLLYSKQESSYEPVLSLQGGAVSVSYYHLAGDLYLSEDALAPYVTASIGMTELASSSFKTENRFSLGIGTGYKYQPLSFFAISAEIKGMLTALDSKQEMFCPKLGVCQITVDSPAMFQAQANIGIRLQF